MRSGAVQYAGSGATRTLGYCDYFGEGEVMLTDGRHRATATAMTDVEMLEIERGDVQYLLRRRPQLLHRIQQRAL